jgi:hypothetical protein
MSSHNEEEHICSMDCDDNPDMTTDFTLTVLISEDNHLLISEWFYLFNGIFFSLLGGNLISGEQFTIKINNARTLAKILYKLEERLSEDYHISSYIFNSMQNNLTVEIGEY